MAQSTQINATLQARDWEFLIGISYFLQSGDIQDLITKLRVYYNGLTEKPQGNTNVTITTTEGVLVSLFKLFLKQKTITTQTDNNQPYLRIRTQILALNNTADNFILNSINNLESSGQVLYGDIRKGGRKIIMMITYDNN